MRRKEREVKDFDEIVAILDKCSVIHLGMISQGKPYCIPVNFGYVVQEGNEGKRLQIFLHGASEGKKIDAWKSCSDVSFSAECSVEIDSLGEKSDACEWTCFYESVCGAGKIHFVEDMAEREKGLDAIMIHNGYEMPAGIKKIAYNAMALAKTMVARIDVMELTGKIHKR